MILLAVLLPQAAGWGLLQWVHPRGRHSVGEGWALSFLLGQLALCLLFFCLSLGFGGAPVRVMGGLLAALALTGLPLWWRREREDAFRLFPATGWEAVPAAVALLTALMAAIRQWFRPILAHDGFAIYAVKAVAFFQDGGITREFLSRGYPHRDYPPLVPVGEAWTAMVMGRWDQRAIKVQLSLYLLAAVLVIAGVVGRRHGRLAGWSAAAALALTPQVFRWASHATCDWPLAVFLMAGLAVGWEALEEGRRGMAASVLLLTGAVWTKNEGLPLAGLVLVGLAVGYGRSRDPSGRPRWIRLAPTWIILPLLAAPWLLLRISLGLTDDNLNSMSLEAPRILANLERLPGILGYMLQEMVQSGGDPQAGGRWLMGWVAFGAALVIRSLRSGPGRLRPLALVVLLQLAMHGSIFVVTPQKLDLLVVSALDRLLLQVYPAGLLFTALVLAEVLSLRETPGVDPSRGSP